MNDEEGYPLILLLGILTVSLCLAWPTVSRADTQCFEIQNGQIICPTK